MKSEQRMKSIMRTKALVKSTDIRYQIIKYNPIILGNLQSLQEEEPINYDYHCQQRRKWNREAAQVKQQ